MNRNHEALPTVARRPRAATSSTITQRRLTVSWAIRIHLGTVDTCPMKILELTLPSTDLDRQERLYKDTFGFSCTRESETKLRIECGANVLNFVAAKRQFYFHYCFLIPPGCLNSVVDFLDERGLEPLLYEGERLVDFGNGKAVYFWDGDGNLAEFIQRPSLGHPEQTDFAIRDVIRLNEIGMPAENPRQFAEQLIRQFQIDLVEGGIYRDDFVWCGDFEGVFLIPQVGRNWMPANRPAEQNPLNVKFETAAGTFDYTIQI